MLNPHFKMGNINLPAQDNWSYQLRAGSDFHHAGPGMTAYFLGRILQWARAGKRVALRFQDEELLAYWKLRLEPMEQHYAEEAEWCDLPLALEARLLQLEEEHRMARVTVLGNATATDLLGRKQLRSHLSRAALAAFSINTEGLEFNESEYYLLLDQIKNTKKLLSRLGQADPALRQLNSGIFRHQTEAESEAFIQEQLNAFQGRAAGLYRAYSLVLDRFSALRLGAANRAFREASAAAQPLTLFLQIQQAPLKGKQRDAYRKQLKPVWSNWSKSIRESDLFVFDLPEKPEKESLVGLRALLQLYQKQLQEWYQNQARKVHEESVGLSPGSLAAQDPLKAELAQLAQRLENLVADLNESGLYQLPLSADAATSLRQHKQLEQLLDQMQQCRHLLTHFSPNYRWQHNWFSLHPAARRIVSPLLHLPEEDWEVLYSNWYMGQCINRSGLGRQLATSLAARLDMAEEVEQWRFRSLSLRAPHLLMEEEEDPAAEWDYLIDIDWEAGEQKSGNAKYHFQGSLLPAPGASYHVQTGPGIPASLGFLQPTGPRAIPDWRLRPAWPNAGKQAYSVGMAPVNFRGQWPPALPAILEVPSERVQLFIGRIVDNSPGIGALTQLISLPLKLELIHDWEEREITQALLSDGFKLSFLLAAMLRATECVADQDKTGWFAMVEESRLRLGLSPPKEHALLVAISSALAPHCFSLNRPWRDTFLPLVVQSASSGRQTVVLPDGLLPGDASPAEECLRQADLIAAGFALHDLRLFEASEDWEGVVRSVVALSE